MPRTDIYAELRVGPQGRVVIPVDLRQRLGIRPGQTLMAHAEDGRLILEPPETIMARLRARLQVVPDSVSLVEELIAERRQEVHAEDSL